MHNLRFDQAPARRTPSGIDVVTNLAHFAIVTYCVDPDALRRHVDERFDLDTITVDGTEQALVSVVPFMDEDFRFARFSRKTWEFSQTNYRAYVTDRRTGRHVVWFFGTALDTPWVVVPHRRWKLPWHRTSIRFYCDYDEEAERYRQYRMEARGDWGGAMLEIEDSGMPVQELAGFDDFESGLYLLTHPFEGYFYRRDDRLGSYSIWHAPLELTSGRVTQARFDLLDRLGLGPSDDLSRIHSVMLQRRTEFTIYLPPVVEGGGA